MTSHRPVLDPGGDVVGPPAVVIGLDSITGLQTARILADRGVPVIGIVGDRHHWGARTNACAEVLVSPLFGSGLVRCLQELGSRLDDVSVLIPCTDGSVATLSRHRDELADHFVLPLAADPVVEMLMDKVEFARYAAAAGLPFPQTEMLSSRADAERAAQRLNYPCVLKPALKSSTWLAQTSAKGFAVTDARELLSVYDRVAGWSPLLIAQEWVMGGEQELYSCNAYFDEQAQPLVTFVARKVRQWPPDIGTSASGEECRNDEVLQATIRLFGDVGFRGLAYLEMKRDERSGRLIIIEPNVGRPTGRSAIAEAGGVELVYTAYCDAAGLALPSAREQRYVGTKWLDLRRDAQAAALAYRRGDLSISEWVQSLRGRKAHAIWSRHDPMPFAADLLQAGWKGGRILSAGLSTSARAGRAASRTANLAREPVP
ncbi:MAG: carboxylate--amine ligase [Propionibacteriales bacterium]|nr:carboxylate--amine ligase [Propionibacteriales bacterium]